MKKIIIYLTVFLVLIITLFLFLKWSELKYYFRLDNTKAKLLEQKIEIGKVSINDSVLVRYGIVNIGDEILEVKILLQIVVAQF